MKSFRPTIFPEERGNSVKRITAVILAMLLAAGLTDVGAAENTEAENAVSRTLDISYYEENGEYFRTEVSEDGTAAYIQTKASAENRAFSTPYENDLYYSAVFPELMISDWDKEAERTPAFRIWIRYRGTKHLNIGAVSLIADGTDYRFLDVSSPDWIATKEDGTAAQDVQLVLGSDRNNAACFATLFSGAVEYVQSRMTDPETQQPDISLVLHGDEEDIPVVLPADFWSEMAMFAFSLDNINGFPFLTAIPGTPCMVQN